MIYQLSMYDMPKKPFVDFVCEQRDGLVYRIYICYPIYGYTVKYRYTVSKDGYVMQDREFRYKDITGEITGNAGEQPGTVL